MTEQEKAIIRQMADYIEKGAEGKQQITGEYRKNRHEVCAIGAAMVGARSGLSELKLKQKLGIDDYPLVQYPVEGQMSKWWIYDFTNPSPLDSVIICLNDKAGWDFAHIVAWLRSIAE